MNTRLLLAICSVVALSSCATSYKAQTPDDVYFSPAKPAAEYVETNKKEEPKQNYQYQSADDYYAASDDSYLRWKVRNRNRWATFDSYSYDMYPSCTSSYAPWRNYWNSYYSWNNYYNPYCHSVIVANPKTNATVYNRVRTYTPGAYTNNTYNNGNRKPVKVLANSYNNPKATYNNTNSSNNNSFGNAIKKIFSNSGSSYSNNNSSSSSSSSSDRPVRTYSPSSSGSSSSGSSGGSRSSGSSSGGSSGGGVSRPGRG